MKLLPLLIASKFVYKMNYCTKIFEYYFFSIKFFFYYHNQYFFYHSLKNNTNNDNNDDVYTYSIIKEKQNIEDLLKENGNDLIKNDEDIKVNDLNKAEKKKEDFLFSQAPLKTILTTIINNIDEEKLDINSNIVGDIKKKLQKVDTKLIENNKKENFLTLYNQSEKLKKQITNKKSKFLKHNSLQFDLNTEKKAYKNLKVQFKLNNNENNHNKNILFKNSSPNLDIFNKDLKQLSSIINENDENEENFVEKRPKSTERNKKSILDTNEIKTLKRNISITNIENSNKFKKKNNFFKDQTNLFNLSYKENDKTMNKTQIVKNKKKKNENSSLILPKNLFFNVSSKYNLDIQSLLEQTQNDITFLKKNIKSTLFSTNNINNKKKDKNNEINNDSDYNKSDPDSVRFIKRVSKFGLIGIIKNKEKFRILLKKKLVYDSVLSDSEEEYNEVHEKGKFFIKSDGLFKIILDIILFLCVSYDLIIDTLILGMFNKNLNEKPFFFHLCNFIKEIFYIIDFCLGFFITYYSKEDLLISKLNFLIYNYFSTWFLLDLLEAIPVNLILYYKLPKNNHYSQSYNNPISLYYLLTLIQKFKIFKILSENNNIMIFLNKFEHFTFYSSVYISLLGFFLILHNISCIYIFLGKFTYPNWIVHLGLEQDNFIEIYIYALYYIISTVTTVGYGDVSTYTCLERFFGIFILIVGIMGYSLALTSVSGYINKMNSKAENYQENIRFLENLKENNIYFSQELYNKIIRYLKYSHNKYDDINLIVENLPFSLRNALLLKMYNPVVKNFIFFKKISNTDFIIQILLKFKPILSMKNDIILKDGEFQEEVIFIKNGRLSLVVPVDLYETYDFSLHKMKKDELRRNSSIIFENFKNHKKNKESEKEKEKEKKKKYIQILILRENEHYGIINIFLNKRSTLCAKVKSKKAELLLLNKNDVVEISNCYSQIWKRINKKSVTNYFQIDLLIQKTLQMYYLSQGIKKNLFNGFVSENEENKNNINENDNNLASITEDSNESINNSQINTIVNNNNINNNNNNNNITLKQSETGSKNQSNEKQISSKVSIKNEEILENNSEDFITSSEKSEISESQVKDSDSSGMTEFIKNNKNNENSTFISNNTNELFTSNNTFHRIGTFNNLNVNSFKLKKNNKNNVEISYENKTPFKPSDINKEIYPNEEFIFKTNKDHSKKSFIQSIISSKLYQEILKDSPNEFNIHHKNKIIYNESFIINASYKNLNSLSNNKYIKNKKLQEKIENTIIDNLKKNKKSNKNNLNNLIKFHSKKSQFSHFSELKNHFFERKTLSSLINNNNTNNNHTYSNININNINNINNNNIIMLRRNTTNGIFDLGKIQRKKSFSVERIPENLNNQMNLIPSNKNLNSLRNTNNYSQNDKIKRKMSFQSNKIKFYKDKKDLLNTVNNNMKQNMNLNNGLNSTDNFCSEFLLNEIKRNETQKYKKQI